MNTRARLKLACGLLPGLILIATGIFVVWYYGHALKQHLAFIYSDNAWVLLAAPKLAMMLGGVYVSALVSKYRRGSEIYTITFVLGRVLMFVGGISLLAHDSGDLIFAVTALCDIGIGMLSMCVVVMMRVPLVVPPGL